MANASCVQKNRHVVKLFSAVNVCNFFLLSACYFFFAVSLCKKFTVITVFCLFPLRLKKFSARH